MASMQTDFDNTIDDDRKLTMSILDRELEYSSIEAFKEAIEVEYQDKIRGLKRSLILSKLINTYQFILDVVCTKTIKNNSIEGNTYMTCKEMFNHLRDTSGDKQVFTCEEVFENAENTPAGVAERNALLLADVNRLKSKGLSPVVIEKILSQDRTEIALSIFHSLSLKEKKAEEVNSLNLNHNNMIAEIADQKVETDAVYTVLLKRYNMLLLSIKESRISDETRQSKAAILEKVFNFILNLKQEDELKALLIGIKKLKCKSGETISRGHELRNEVEDMDDLDQNYVKFILSDELNILLLTPQDLALNSL
jgi:hypothetical protein